MSSQALKAAATGQNLAQADAPPKQKTVADFLMSPAMKSQIAAALPRHMTPDRLARVVLTQIRLVPKLATADQGSLLGAIMQCAQLGLEPGGALGHVYLLPFDKRGKNAQGRWEVVGTDVQVIIGYRGMIDLARRSGQILSLETRAVYEADEFDVRLGLDSHIHHVPAWDAEDRGDLKFVYAVAKLKDGGTQFEVMSRREVEKVMKASQGYKAAIATAEQYKKDPAGPWFEHFEEMAKKTVIRRLFKYLPVSIEMQRAVGLDEQGDAGIDQGNRLMLEAATAPMLEAPPQGVDGTTGEFTQAEILSSIESATDRDMADAAFDLARMLPEEARSAVQAAYVAKIATFA
jgi:recombination protein RecT